MEEDGIDRAGGMHAGEEKGNRVFGSKADGRRPHEIPKYIQEDNFVMDLTGIRYEGVECICLVQDRDWCRAVVNTIIKLDIP